MAKKKKDHFWMVVLVQSGIPVTVKAYWKYKNAEKREKKYRQNINLNNDETGVFKIKIPKIKA